MEYRDEIEASTLDLIEVRLITYKAQGTSKFVVGSTPTVPEMPISIEAAKGTQERFFVPCPECGYMQQLKFEHFSWSPHQESPEQRRLLQSRPGREAHRLRVPESRLRRGARIPHEKKQWMMRRGEWRAQNPNAPADHRSFYIGGELSTALTWGMLAKKFLETQHLPGGLHNFYNSYLGRAWERKTGGATRKAIQLIQEASPKFNLWQPQDPAAALTCRSARSPSPCSRRPAARVLLHHARVDGRRRPRHHRDRLSASPTKSSSISRIGNGNSSTRRWRAR
jgi:phage terminase large subunit GpA-like protein